jgi:hypothetical protein
VGNSVAGIVISSARQRAGRCDGFYCVGRDDSSYTPPEGRAEGCSKRRLAAGRTPRIDISPSDDRLRRAASPLSAVLTGLAVDNTGRRGAALDQRPRPPAPASQALEPKALRVKRTNRNVQIATVMGIISLLVTHPNWTYNLVHIGRTTSAKCTNLHNPV